MLRFIVVALAFFTAAPTSRAGEQEYPHSAKAGVLVLTTIRTVRAPNDILNATLIAEATGQDATKLARQVNQTVARARQAIGKDKAVRLRTLGYTTQPLFESNPGNQGNRRTGWTVRQTVQLESQDFAQASNRLAELQVLGLKLEGLEFGLTPAVREHALVGVRETALRAWMAQTDQAVKTLGAKGWRPGRLSLYDGHPPAAGGDGFGLAAAGAGSGEEELPPLMLDPGETSVVASVQGEAVLLYMP